MLEKLPFTRQWFTLSLYMEKSAASGGSCTLAFSSDDQSSTPVLSGQTATCASKLYGKMCNTRAVACIFCLVME